MSTTDEIRKPLVGLVMGSHSEWPVMSHAAVTLDSLGVPYEPRVLSAHRTPDLMFEYAQRAEGRGLLVLIAGAGGAAHLPGMLACKTLLPVIGVPVATSLPEGIGALLSMVQLPAGAGILTSGDVGRAGAINAALNAALILGDRPEGKFRVAVGSYRELHRKRVQERQDPWA